jgi:hypothetical protein
LCLAVFRLAESLRAQRVDMQAVLLLLIICLFTSVVKYAALPLLIAAVLFVVVVAWRAFKGQGRRLRLRIKDGYLRLTRRSRIVLIAAVVVGFGLFAQRYVVNIVQYGHPVPDCGKVLTTDQCLRYGPWGRDYGLAQNKPSEFKPNPLTYSFDWLRGMRHRLFFAVNGPASEFHNVVELPVPVITATVIFAGGLLATVIWWRRVFVDNSYRLFFAMLIGLYAAVLFYDQYGMYTQTGVPVAINGRYLLPVILPMAALLGAGIVSGLRRFKLSAAKPYLVVLAIALFLHGGGLLTFIMRSDSSWYWPNGFVQQVNNGTRRVLEPVIIEGDKTAIWQ